MDWSNASIGTSRLHSWPASRLLHGRRNYHGCYWESGQHRRRTLVLSLLSWSMVPCSLCPVIWPHQKTPRTRHITSFYNNNSVVSQTPVPTSAHGQRSVHLPDGLDQARFVFLRRDAHRPPLQPPYEGPYPAVGSSGKHFTVDLGGRLDRVSIDRLKPAFVDPDSAPPSLTRPSPGQSAAGRRSRRLRTRALGGALWRVHSQHSTNARSARESLPETQHRRLYLIYRIVSFVFTDFKFNRVYKKPAKRTVTRII